MRGKNILALTCCVCGDDTHERFIYRHRNPTRDETADDIFKCWILGKRAMIAGTKLNKQNLHLLTRPLGPMPRMKTPQHLRNTCKGFVGTNSMLGGKLLTKGFVGDSDILEVNS